MKHRAFTLAELLVVVITVSIFMVAMAPVMTQRAKNAGDRVEIVTTNKKVASVPIGSIIMWYGENIPEGWIKVSGQDLNQEGFEELKTAVQADFLPDLNQVMDGMESPVKWIIKYSEKTK